MTSTDDTTTTRGIFPGPYARRHPRAVASVRIAVAILLLVLAGILWSHIHYWSVALVAVAVLHLWLAARLRPWIHGPH